jgi:hypothetical protein
MFVRPPRGACHAPAGVQISTAIHSLRPAVTVFEELRTKLPRLDSITKTRGCHAFVSEPSFEQIAQAVPRRHDLCGGGPWRRGRRFARFLPLRGASRRSADQSDRRFRNKSGTGVVAAAAQARPRRFPDRPQGISRSGEKNCDRCRNPSPGSPLIVRRRAKPPSPSPSITRCRTPAAFAVGVHLFVPLKARSFRGPRPDCRDGSFPCGRNSPEWPRFRRTSGPGFFAHPPRHRRITRARFRFRPGRG